MSTRLGRGLRRGIAPGVIEYIEKTWTDILPLSLVEAMQGR